MWPPSLPSLLALVLGRMLPAVAALLVLLLAMSLLTEGPTECAGAPGLSSCAQPADGASRRRWGAGVLAPAEAAFGRLKRFVRAKWQVVHAADLAFVWRPVAAFIICIQVRGSGLTCCTCEVIS